MRSVQMKYAMYVGSLALAAVGLMAEATTAAMGVRGADGPRATVEFRRSGAESLDAWIDSVRRQHNIPAMGAVVFRADTGPHARDRRRAALELDRCGRGT